MLLMGWRGGGGGVFWRGRQGGGRVDSPRVQLLSHVPGKQPL